MSVMLPKWDCIIDVVCACPVAFPKEKRENHWLCELCCPNGTSTGTPNAAELMQTRSFFLARTLAFHFCTSLFAWRCFPHFFWRFEPCCVLSRLREHKYPCGRLRREAVWIFCQFSHEPFCAYLMSFSVTTTASWCWRHLFLQSLWERTNIHLHKQLEFAHALNY